MYALKMVKRDKLAAHGEGFPWAGVYRWLESHRRHVPQTPVFLILEHFSGIMTICILSQTIAQQGVATLAAWCLGPNAVPRRAMCWNIPSAVGRALNKDRVIQHSLGPLVPPCALKNCRSLSARDGHLGEGVTSVVGTSGRTAKRPLAQPCPAETFRRTDGSSPAAGRCYATGGN